MYRGTNDPKVAQYQRAVTPTIDPPQPQAHLTGSVGAIGSLAAATAAASSGSTSATIRGKVLSYNPPSSRSNFRTTSTVQPTTIGSSNTLLNNHNAQFRTGHAAGTAPPDITVQGVRSSGPGPTSTGRMNSLKPSEFHDQLSTLSMLPRYDLIPLVDEIPPDGIIFAKIKPNSASYAHVPSDTLVVFRTSEERLRNPERLNLDRRQLDHCPLLEQEQRLRLLNYQNNNIKFIANLENLPNLIFLDLYNNKIITLDGPISVVKGLRVLMAGKNRISRISNLTSLKKLDVLDLHSNDIRVVEGLDGLTDLRVLNLAGNKIAHVDNLNTLTSLTELNLRRNNITHIFNLQHLPALQRIFLSHNQIMHYQDIACVFSIANLIELSLDNNPVADKDPSLYRFTVLSYLSSLKHLDLKRVTEDERSLIQSNHLNLVLPPLLSDNSGSPPLDVPPSDALRDDDRSESDRNSASPPLQEDIGSGGNTEVTGKNRAQSPSANDQPVSSAELIASSDSMDDQEGVTGIAVPGNTIPDGAFEAKTGGGLAALARAGRISKSQSVFDIEVFTSASVPTNCIPKLP